MCSDELPIAQVAESIAGLLKEEQRVVVTAPPGAGKSTLLPLVLLEHLPEGKIIMLEPRRIAARQVAERMASMLGERPGETVGYRMRFESRVSATTRIEVLTEGILERMLVEDPTLEGIAIVIFDEFHERSLTSDLTVALTMEAQNLIRPDLRILIMSATIDADPLCRRIGARHVHSEGRMFDVEMIYGDDFDPRDCPTEVARAVARARRAHPRGNILAFLPGEAEIHRCAELLEGQLPGADVLPLYGMLPPEEQRRVLAPPPPDRPRIVLATPIAETSLTIEGITVVVDSGLCRRPVFDPATGLTRLTTVGISRDMATQRAGRAGRLSCGVCYRLWSRGADARMASCREPEISTADLASTVLQIASWGESDPLRLPWVTPPPAGHIAKARRLLSLMGALTPDGSITAAGRRMAALPCHPRIAGMLLGAARSGAVAADIAALLEEKDPLGEEAGADIAERIDILRRMRNSRLAGPWRRIDAVAAIYRRMAGARPDNGPVDPFEVGRLVAIAFPERIAKRCDDGRYRLSGDGSYGELHPADNLAAHPILAVASMGKLIYLAAPLAEQDAESCAAWSPAAFWDSRAGRAIVREELRLGTLTLATRPPSADLRAMAIDAIIAAAPKEGLSMFDFNDEVEALQTRITVVAEWHPEMELPDVTTAAILARAAEWVPMYAGRATTIQELRKIDMTAVVMGMLDYSQQQELERLAPSRIKLPAGRSARVVYRPGAPAPIVSARLQDCFGLMSTPMVDDGRRPVLMELLSPGFKPVQLTQDLEGFWRTTYYEVRKELRRRYPKHRWPDNVSGQSDK